MQIQFAEENGFDQPEDPSFVSVFEVLAVMAIRAEEEIMCNDEYGDRSHIWFWDMMRNLDLDAYSDDRWDSYSERDIDEIVVRFLNRDYNDDGSDGGAFILEYPRDDLRDVDLWYQMLWWLTENYGDEF